MRPEHYDPGMDQVTQRVSEWLQANGRDWAWLASRLPQHTLERVLNWRRRERIPPGEYPAVAAALGKSVQWMHGFDDDGAPPMSEPARELGRLLDLIESQRDRVRAFAACVAILTRARDQGPPT